MADYSNDVMFITGGASGAGFGHAQVFGRAGAAIVVADIRQDAVDEAVAKLAAEGIRAHGIQLDITDRAAYAAAADEVEAVFGKTVTILSNTAGVNSFGPVERTTYDDFDWIIDVNLNGVINGMVTFVPRMIAAGTPAKIVTVSSLGGLGGSALAAPYSAAKAGVINLMESYNMSLSKYNIDVSVVCPANIKSNIADATKLRPAHLANSGYVENEESRASLESIHQHGMEPETLAQHIMNGLEAKQLYIIPYPECAGMVKARFDQILDSIPSVETDPEGSKNRTDALMSWGANGAKVFLKDK